MTKETRRIFRWAEAREQNALARRFLLAQRLVEEMLDEETLAEFELMLNISFARGMSGKPNQKAKQMRGLMLRNALKVRDQLASSIARIIKKSKGLELFLDLTCPKCGRDKVELGHRSGRCGSCGLIATRKAFQIGTASYFETRRIWLERAGTEAWNVQR